MSQTLNSSMKTVKFLYSYGGKIIPRPSDGKLRYVGGYTRVLSVDRSVTFSDLDVLISIKSDEDLRSVIEEYERASPEAKIRAVLFPIKSAKKVSPPSSPMSCFDFPSVPQQQQQQQRMLAPSTARYYRAPPSYRCFTPAVGYPVATAAKYNCFDGRSPAHFYHELFFTSRPRDTQWVVVVSSPLNAVVAWGSRDVQFGCFVLQPLNLSPKDVASLLSQTPQVSALNTSLPTADASFTSHDSVLAVSAPQQPSKTPYLIFFLFLSLEIPLLPSRKFSLCRH
ncbi:hypothetical protein BUALT_Bualt07G0021200 [Buddleja alternifolia]|uniref:PB1 domain-containing protein n=1 Tax=Buddleja alternifolia TaxID=168488 RepID=A0AAV6X7H9_9LAMI|nr:hypothetical protein BUALT_Bualt07G0021200 [Buddleja alternifolia]